MTIKKRINKWGPMVIDKLGFILNPIILKFNNENNHLLIYCFHGLYESVAQKDLNHIDPQNNITVSQLIEFIDYFLNLKFIFIKPEDLLGELKKNQTYVMITFDDGYFNNSLAIDVISKFKIPIVFFITTRNVCENKSFWWDVIYKYRSQKQVSLEKIYNELAHLKQFKYPEIEKYLVQNFGTICENPWSDIDRPFNSEELKYISENDYISIGNHTHNHAILTNYSNQEIKEEIEESQKILTELTGSEPITIAFPNGNFNSSVLNITKQAGFRFAFTTKYNINTIPQINNNLITLNRFMAQTNNIQKYGSFNRLNYNGVSLFSNIKHKIISNV
jgi:peptidoglycan/xylan/chitin deacetylase (PgdA/CDA1 family)